MEWTCPECSRNLITSYWPSDETLWCTKGGAHHPVTMIPLEYRFSRLVYLRWVYLR